MKERLGVFIDQLPMDEFCKKIQNKYGIDGASARQLLDTFANEAKTTFDVVEDCLSKDKTILEVGAGLCFFSLFLKKEGYNIVALEPAIGGFDLFNNVKSVILKHYADVDLHVLDIPADRLSIEGNGQFDIIFSNNVIEHIPNLQETFFSLTKVLSDKGIMLHACPNYIVPYEPHFSIPVIKPFSNLTKLLFKVDRLPNYDVWKSLNFITFFDVKKLAYENELNVDFRTEVLYKALLRLEQDEVFYKRHSGGFIYKFYSLIKKLKLLELIKYLPPILSTPMVFKMTKKESY